MKKVLHQFGVICWNHLRTCFLIYHFTAAVSSSFMLYDKDPAEALYGYSGEELPANRRRSPAKPGTDCWVRKKKGKLHDITRLPHGKTDNHSFTGLWPIYDWFHERAFGLQEEAGLPGEFKVLGKYSNPKQERLVTSEACRNVDRCIFVLRTKAGLLVPMFPLLMANSLPAFPAYLWAQ